jgi:hypothetical protein
MDHPLTNIHFRRSPLAASILNPKSETAPPDGILPHEKVRPFLIERAANETALRVFYGLPTVNG